MTSIDPTFLSPTADVFNMPRPPLPQGYRFVSDRAQVSTRIEDIFEVLTRPDIYWSKDRTLEIFKMEIEKGHRAVMILKGGEGAEGELAGFCRVVGDGWDFAYLDDVVTVHRGAGLSHALLWEAIFNSSERPEKPSNLWKWALFTKDMHRLYSKFGFVTDLGMVRKSPLP